MFSNRVHEIEVEIEKFNSIRAGQLLATDLYIKSYTHTYESNIWLLDGHGYGHGHVNGIYIYTHRE